ncbi:MAG: hypothetical protein K5855_00435 [Oscillospiraceae bacterium]|nr:hypothetical protein [Oscillospiraceae bacterium]
MKTGRLKLSAALALFFAAASLITLIGSTYAWFTFRSYTNVTPISGTVSNGDGSLLIANREDAVFSEYCELLLSDASAELLPISTPDLESFFTVVSQNRGGIATGYAPAEERAKSNTLNGTLYLKGEGAGFDVYFWMPNMDCGTDGRALAAMRLGLKITAAAGTETHIFRLDSMGDTSAAETRRTVPESDTVVAGIGDDGKPEYAADPAADISEAAAGGTEDDPLPGSLRLCAIAADETVRVDFWLYLEGCDDNCINSAQGRDIALRFGFAGIENDM